MIEPHRHTFAMACLFLTLLLICMYIIGTPARSQEAPKPRILCAPTPAIIEMLNGKYGESPAAAGVANGNAPLLIFTNPKTGTFTITLRRPGGVSCLMTSGQSWTLVEQTKEGTDL